MQSRRSNGNLTYLTLSPITTRIPLADGGDEDVEVPTPWTQRTSYLAGKSAPSTPRILSRSSSRTRLDRISSTKLATSKSYTHLASGAGGGGGHDLAPLSSRPKSSRGTSPARRKKSGRSTNRLSQPGLDSGEWLYRAGTAISSETRESKGQGWLVNRESSTSLVAGRGDDEDETTDDNDVGRRSINTGSARTSRAHSRNHSRTQSLAASAKTSRRGSKSGARPDLSYFATPVEGRTPAAARAQEMSDYFGRIADPAVLAGPDFVDEEDFGEESFDSGDEEDEEEERRQEDEIRKLAADRSFGFGSVVDRFLGWTLFDADGTETEDEGVATPTQRSTLAKNGKKASKVKIDTSSASKGKDAAEGGAQEGSQTWNDAAWLLSVASKVLL